MDSQRKICISDSSSTGKCVVYVMSRDQRVDDNFALIEAQKEALHKKLPLAVVFCLMPKAGYRAREHYEFMLSGLNEVEAKLKQLNIIFIMVVGNPKEKLPVVINTFEPESVYFDMSPLNGPKSTVEVVKKAVSCAIYVVDTHNIVPVWVASHRQEYGARTIRPKIHKILPEFLHEPVPISRHPYDWPGNIMSINSIQKYIDELLDELPRNNQLLTYVSGESASKRALKNFIKNLNGYDLKRNDPNLNGQSELSPYLHFGQISSLRVVLAVIEAVSSDERLRGDADAFIEELVVRKELSDNYCYYNSNYNSIDGAADWAKATLNKHKADPREFIYSTEQFENAQTHDEAWNAAQKQLLKTGKMHGYMRMYWAKKVLEWSESPENAIETLIYINDFYSIDGGDPNGYVGILWSVAGLHDRPWGERAVYGTIRCMVYSGLKRKFDIESYIKMYS